MDTFILLVAIALLIAAIRSHAMAQANVHKIVDRVWFERLFTGSRASKENLTEVGLRYRKNSNLYAIAGFLMIGLYAWFKFES